MIAIPYYRTRNPAAVSDGNPLIHETLADFAAEN
ncbi:hypothetical protein JOD67_000254 [Tenggerimyces flavus]|nr:hypothetical protein [Tenggerimyces flavus]